MTQHINTTASVQHVETNAPEHGAHRRELFREQYASASMDEKIILNLRDISHIMRGLYEGKASQKRILIILYESDTMTQRALTKRLGIQPGSASEILAKLENAGLITRTTNDTDRRTTDVRLTEAGTELAREALQQRQKRHQDMFACLSSEEQQALLALLEKLHADWDQRFGSRSAHQHPHKGHGRSANAHEGHPTTAQS